MRSRASRSLFVFAIYVILVGIAFVAVPERVISLLQLPPAAAGWGRVVGLLALVIGTYDLVAARADLLVYVRASVYVRFGFAAGVTLLVVTHQMPVTILPLAAIDAISALWTAIELKRS